MLPLMDAPDTRHKLLKAAYELMISRGYSATGVGDICEAAGVSKGSFYHFFATKEECAIAVMQAHGQEADEVLARDLEIRGLTGPAAALEYVRRFEDRSQDYFCDGCIIGTFALELAKTHPDLRKEIEGQLNEFTDQLEKGIKPIYANGIPPGAPTTRELADQMLIAIEGGVVLSKAYGDLTYVSRAVRGFRLYLETLVPTAAKISH